MSMSFYRTVLLALVASTLLLVSTAWEARAGGCKPNGQVCSTNMSCCTKNCAKPIVKKATALFGLCCPQGARLFNGTCCTPAASCPAGTCGSISDGCGGTLNCGGCNATQCLTCVSNACVSACTSEEVCDQGVCETTTTTMASTTTTTLPQVCMFFCANSMIGRSVCLADCPNACSSYCGQACQGPGGSCVFASVTCGDVCETTTTTTTETTTTTMGCMPLSCPLGQNCGTAPDGCGDTLDCGTCSPMLMCEEVGIPHCCQPDRGTDAMCNPMLPCCLGGTCKSPGFCCSSEGGSCFSSSDCCNGNCVTGICGPPT